MITINATVFVKENSIEEYKELSEKLIRGTQAEVGNLRYDMYQSVKRPGEFMFVEQYMDQNALDTHHSAEHFTQFLASVEKLLSKDMDVKVFRELPKAE